MLSNHPDLLNNYNRVFHVSEEPGISVFEPRPSPSYFESINGDVVFAVSGQLLHNYLLPRDCPRVTWYAGEHTNITDKNKYLNSTTPYVVTVESGWYQRIKSTVLYCYEFPINNFMLLDECAGYYISYQQGVPISVTVIDDIITELLKRNVELRFTPSLIQLAAEIKTTSLNFSLIRIRNAKS